VADFFGGSGTTGVAAKRHGRRFILVDENPEAIRIAQKRLAAEAEPSPSLFEGAG
jgi:site-specific DNA-methyltransferase (adenine-specific)